MVFIVFVWTGHENATKYFCLSVWTRPYYAAVYFDRQEANSDAESLGNNWPKSTLSNLRLICTQMIIFSLSVGNTSFG